MEDLSGVEQEVMDVVDVSSPTLKLFLCVKRPSVNVHHWVIDTRLEVKLLHVDMYMYMWTIGKHDELRYIHIHTQVHIRVHTHKHTYNTHTHTERKLSVNYITHYILYMQIQCVEANREYVYSVHTLLYMHIIYYSHSFNCM